MPSPSIAAALLALVSPLALFAVEPVAEPTFNCLGLYWKPDGGSAQKQVDVAYRAAGGQDWREAMPLWFDSVAHKDEGKPHSNEYRGSVVNLKPDTEYEVRLTMAGASPVTLTTRTWNDNFKIAKTIPLPATANETFVIKDGGNEKDGYVLYEAPKGATWDADNRLKAQVQVDASYVILRGLTLKNSAEHGIVLGDVDHVVIEDCDISGWGKVAADGWGENLDAAIYSQSRKLSRIVIQRNRLHHPRSNANSWVEKRMHDGKESPHPIGPQGIVFMRPEGHLVIRYNRIDSDLQHQFNDSMGETHNFSFDGFPGRDSDIYGNYISNTWDDGIEVEGADMNVRVWGNYITNTYGAFGCASPSLGPLYLFRNVYAVSRKHGGNTEDGFRGHYLIKLGNEKSEWTQGRMYIFHNTILQPPAFEGSKARSSGAQSGIAFTSDQKTAFNITSRNNVIDLRTEKDWAIHDTQKTASNDYDYDLINGKVLGRPGTEAHAIIATPVWERSPDGKVLWLKAGSPGFDAAVRLPNFNDDFVGAGPDVGAIEAGSTTPRPATWPEFPPPTTRPAVEATSQPASAD
jgi:hypothetical protein